MIVDSRTIPENEVITTDVCIAGAGVAGLTLAQEMAGADFRIGLLECGGLQPDNATQSFFWGQNRGHPYYPLDTARSCGVGGSAHKWNIDLFNGQFGVRLHPLDTIDFEERPWVPNSGWPFAKAHLDPFYERAQQVCKIGPYAYDVDHWENGSRSARLTFRTNRIQTTIFQFAQRMTFLKDHYQSIQRAENITTYLHAHAAELESDAAAKTVKRLRVAALNGKRFWVVAKLFVLALGAIETPRLMLISNQVQKTGLGNQNDLVGRYFMEHPHLWSGRYMPATQKLVSTLGLYRLHRVNGTPIMGKLTIHEGVQRVEKLANYCVSIHPVVHGPRPNIAPGWHIEGWPLLDSHQPLEHLSGSNTLASVYHETHAILSRTYRRFKKPGTTFKLNHMSEQIPNPDSRVLLIAEKDALGRNRVCLDWRLAPLDIRSIIRAQEIINEELQAAGLGRLQIEMSAETPPTDLHGGWHHMGTTRMHVDPRKGVVDENGKVHEISNLFVAGPSLFPTGGYANPVLTIVALSIRMADHLRGQLQ